MTKSVGTWAAVLGWPAVAVAVVAATAAAGSPVGDVVVYLATWVVSTTVPGVLVWRALARPSSLPEELAFGNVLGIALLLLAWVPAVLIADARLAWWWPVTVIAAFVCVPSLRTHWWPRRARRSRTPTRWHLATAAVCLVALGRLFVVNLRKRYLPGTEDTRIHPDIWFQQTLVNQLQETLALQQPQVAGRPKDYHWFSNADAAVTAAMSGVPTTTVVLQLWLVAMVLTMVLATVGLAWRLMDTGGDQAVRKWWVSPLASLLVAAVPVVVVLGEPRLRNIGNGFIEVSLSGMLAIPVVLGLSAPVIDLLRGRGGRGTWVLAVLLLALAAGTKPSILPIAVAAALLIATVRYVTTRRLSPAPVALVVLGLALFGLSSFALMGGEAGSRVLPFLTLTLDESMQIANNTDDIARIVRVGIVVYLLHLATEVPRLVGVLAVAYRRTRPDPAVWWCAGSVFAGYCASWLVAHPGYSQQYFWRVVIVLATVTSIVVAVRAVPDEVRGRSAAVPLLAVIVPGLAIGTWVLTWEPVDWQEASTGGFDRLVPYALAAAVLVLLVGLLRAPVLHRRLTHVPVATLVLAFAFAAGTPAAVDDLREPVRLAVTDEPIPYSEREQPRLVTAEEQRAALWLRDQGGSGGRVVTNVMCVPTQFERGCQATAYWVAALSDRPMVLGGWAYTEKGRDGLGIDYKMRQPPFPERFRLSMAMIRDPSADVARKLQEKYDARWIFADRRATDISSHIDRYADLRYENSDVRVYELR